MNPRRFGIIVGIIVIVLAAIYMIAGRILMPDRMILTAGGVIFIILGFVLIIFTVINNRRSR